MPHGMTMQIDCISDIHGYAPKLSSGDILIIAGDCTSHDQIGQWAQFFAWLKKQDYKKKILVAGNHDNLFQIGFPQNEEEAEELKEVQGFIDHEPDFEYLCDSGVEIEGVNFWGSPWTSKFSGINPKCCAFTLDNDDMLANKFSSIPDYVDVLITHSPPFGILDNNGRRHPCGSKVLRNIVLSKKRTPDLKYHVFGHIHEEGGRQFKLSEELTFINCCYVNERYEPSNDPIRIII